jgi:organic hydroperoxide reductase OsmC/OhrA
MTEKSRFLFVANAAWKEGRTGELKSRGLPTLDVSPPSEFKGREDRWTPELLYVGSVASCIMASFAAIAEFSTLEFQSLNIEAEGKLEMPDGSGYEMTEITLRPTLVISHSRDLERTDRILEKTEKNVS